MRVLVTGVSGFVGSNLALRLLELGHEVRGADVLPCLLPKVQSFEFRQFDLCNIAATIDFAKDCEIIFHQAAFRSIPWSIENPQEAFSNNLMSTLAVCEAARKQEGCRVVFASSSSVYGDAQVHPTPEDSPLKPLSPYSTSKIAGEHMLASYNQCYGIPITILRYFNIYGARSIRVDKQLEVIPLFIRTALAGETLHIFGNGEQTRDFVYVSDVVSANIGAMNCEKSFGIFNVGSGESASLREIVAIISDVFGRGVPAVFAPERWGDIRNTLADITQAREHLAYTPAYDLRTGIEETTRLINGEPHDR